jgi:hypothetical protein
MATCGGADRPPATREPLAPCSALRVGGTGKDSIDSVALDRDGDAVVGGVFSAEIELGGRTLRAAGGTDGFVARFRSIDPAERRIDDDALERLHAATLQPPHPSFHLTPPGWKEDGHRQGDRSRFRSTGRRSI